MKYLLPALLLLLVSCTNITEDQMRTELEKANYCTTNQDCVALPSACPFGCNIAVNEKESSRLQGMLNKFQKPCTYMCIRTDGFQCKEGKCVSYIIEGYDDCVAAGYPITKSKPPKCQTPDGRSFTQALPREYVLEDPARCEGIRFKCKAGQAAFFDDTGCGCEGTPEVQEITNWVSYDPEECKTVMFTCVQGMKPFFDDTGCDCKGAPVPDVVPEDTSGKELEQHECTPQDREGDACTMNYSPVCGWFGKNVQCVKYPCAETFGNSCGACHNQLVEYWTEGECPK